MIFKYDYLDDIRKLFPAWSRDKVARIALILKSFLESGNISFLEFKVLLMIQDAFNIINQNETPITFELLLKAELRPNYYAGLLNFIEEVEDTLPEDFMEYEISPDITEFIFKRIEKCFNHLLGTRKLVMAQLETISETEFLQSIRLSLMGSFPYES